MIAAHHACAKTFTVPMVRRAIDVTYAGTHDVSPGQRARLRHYVRCLKNPNAGAYVHGYWARRRSQWLVRRQPPACTQQLASYYLDGGQTASGYHATYGVANKVLPFGTRVTISYHGRQITAVVDDRGPYVGSRVWDLNQNVAGVLGFGGVDYVCVSVSGL